MKSLAEIVSKALAGRHETSSPHGIDTRGEALLLRISSVLERAPSSFRTAVQLEVKGVVVVIGERENGEDWEALAGHVPKTKLVEDLKVSSGRLSSVLYATDEFLLKVAELCSRGGLLEEVERELAERVLSLEARRVNPWADLLWPPCTYDEVSRLEAVSLESNSRNCMTKLGGSYRFIAMPAEDAEPGAFGEAEELSSAIDSVLDVILSDTDRD